MPHTNLLTLSVVAFAFSALFPSNVVAQSAQDEGLTPLRPVSEEDLVMNRYRLDTAANALILFDQGSLVVDLFKGTNFTRRLRLKFLHKEAFSTWGQFNAFSPKGGLSKIKVTTYNLEDGHIKETEISSREILETRLDKRTVRTTIPFPNLKEGSVVDCSYTYSIKALRFSSWTFQYSIPVVFSEFLVGSFMRYSSYLRGSLTLARSGASPDNTRRYYQMRDIPAFKSEPQMAAAGNYVSRLELGLGSQNWSDVYHGVKPFVNFDRPFQGQIYLDPFVDSLVRGVNDPFEKVKRISGFIKKKVKWDETNELVFEKPSDVLARKNGSSADLNGLLACMLQKAGIDVQIVLLSTRSHGIILDDLPSVEQFNYLICRATVGDRELLLDATESLLPYDMLPLRCYNHRGFLLGSREYEWLTIEPLKRKKSTVEAHLVLDPTGRLTGTASFIHDDFASFEARQNYKLLGDEEYKRRLNAASSDFHFKEIDDMGDIYSPLTERFEVDLTNYATVANDLMYLDPNVFPENNFFDFRESERHLPIDFDYLLDKTVLCTIVIPKGYEIDELPQSKVLTIGDKSASYVLNVAKLENGINITSRLMTNRTVFKPVEYAALRDFYSRVVSDKSQMIVFRKKK